MESVWLDRFVFLVSMRCISQALGMRANSLLPAPLGTLTPSITAAAVVDSLAINITSAWTCSCVHQVLTQLAEPAVDQVIAGDESRLGEEYRPIGLP